MAKAYSPEISQIILLLHDDKKTPKEISKQLNITYNGVRLFLKNRGFVPHVKPKRDRSRPCVICNNSFIPKYDDGIKKNGCKTCSKECARKLFASYKIKYTKEQIDEVIELKKQLIPHKIIAEKVGMGMSTIKTIVNQNNLQLLPEQIQINAHTARKNMSTATMSYNDRKKCMDSIEKDILENKGTAHGLAIRYGLNPNSVIGTLRKQNKTNLLGIKESTGQKSLYSFICNIVQKHDVLYNDRTMIKPKELDVYIISKKVGIEYNGLHWHTENKIGKNAHYDKMKISNINGIRLLTIFEHEWMTREKQIKNFIKSVLGVSYRTVGARKTEINQINSDMGKQFMNENHIQGASRTSLLYLGIFFKNELLGVLSLGKHHRGTDDSTIVLDRLCFLDGVSVQGGSSKLLKHSIKWAIHNNYKKLISWSDNRWSEGNVYEKLGFLLEEELKPDYFYTKNGKVFSKQSMKKKDIEKLSNKTEKEIRMEQGYERIYDCGKKRWSIKLI